MKTNASDTPFGDFWNGSACFCWFGYKDEGVVAVVEQTSVKCKRPVEKEDVWKQTKTHGYDCRRFAKAFCIQSGGALTCRRDK